MTFFSQPAISACSALASCSADFAPIFYRRYVDDCCLLFNEQSHADGFLSFPNSKHKSIKLTMEMESGEKLPLLDVMVRKEGGQFHTSVYRKPSFSNRY